MPQKSSKDPCAICVKGGVHTNSIFFDGCSSWVHKTCNGIPGPLKPDPSFRCKQCIEQARPVDDRPMTEVTMGREKLEEVLVLLPGGLLIMRWQL